MCEYTRQTAWIPRKRGYTRGAGMSIRFVDREQLMNELLATIRVNPNAEHQTGMAHALGISPRTLSRARRRLQIPWPPVDGPLWGQLAREARTHKPAVSSWLITCRVAAPSLSDAEAKLLAGDGATITIIEAKRLEPISF